MAKSLLTVLDDTSLERSMSMFRPLTFGGRTLDVECNMAVMNNGLAPATIAAACSDKRGIALAMQMSEALSRQAGLRDEGCVYVIASANGRHSKIGVTTVPHNRLSELQLANAETLHVAALFWIYGPAYVIEQRALAAAADRRLRGEWVDMPASDAALVVAEVLANCSVPAATSAMWIKNRRATQLAKHDYTGIRDSQPDAGLGYARQRF